MVTSPRESGRIAVDAMGGDLGPAEVVEAVKLALDQNHGLHPVTLVGDRAVLEPLLERAGLRITLMFLSSTLRKLSRWMTSRCRH